MSNNKSDKKEIINIALVGCGRISYNHFQAINDNAADFNLCAICDTDKEKAQAAATKHDVSYYLRLRELLESHPEVELVALCTPSGIHPCQSILASKYGKHVLTEKPMGL